MSSEYDWIEIFDTCLRAVEQGKASIEQCVRRSPQVEGLREMLETAEAARHLPVISMASARKAEIGKQLASKIKVSKTASRRPARLWRPLPLTYAATLLFMFVVGVVLVRAVLQRSSLQQPATASITNITASATPELQITDTPIPSTPSPQSADDSAFTASMPQVPTADEFAVSVTLTGVVQAVTMESQGSLTTSLDDGSLILVNPNTDGPQNLIAGNAVNGVATT